MSEKNKTIQQKLTELSALVEWFQSEDFSLEAAVEKYKTAEALADTIEKDLTGIKNEIKVLRHTFEQDSGA